MKKTITAVLALALFTCLIIYSCQKEKNGSSERESSEILKKESSLSSLPDKKGKLGWTPPNSKISEIEGGLTVNAPGGWKYLGYDAGHNLVTLSDRTTKTINCTCNTTGTCKPFKSSSPFGGTQGCAGTCTNCTMKQSLIDLGKIFDLENGGYFNPGLETRLLRDGESAATVFEALLAQNDFQKELERFMKVAYSGKAPQSPVYLEDGSITAPKGHSLVAISIMGRGMGVILPEDYVISKLGYYASSKASCSCSTEGGCTLKSGNIGIASAYWCQGDCSSCTLTTSSRIPLPVPDLKQGLYNVQLIRYAY